MTVRYQEDFYGWTQEQAKLLRSGKLSAVDLEHIAEEIESMGASERRELTSRLAVLLAHLLKWQYQPGHRGSSWTRTIREQRIRIAGHLTDNPSLKSFLPVAIDRGYELALIAAVDETGLAESIFPPTCPYTIEQTMDTSFWPEA